jgi:signal transduction histidine kinase
MFNTLSGRFLILTIVFVMLAEVLIFVPSIARFRVDYLNTRIERAQIASLALLADDMLAPELEAELLQNAGVYNVVLVRNETRQLALSSTLPSPVADTYDLRDPGIGTLIIDALYEVTRTDDRIIRAVGLPKLDGGDLIEITLDAGPLQHAMRDYGLRILWLSAIISIFTAVLLNLVVRWVIVRPIAYLGRSMREYEKAPQDARRIIQPRASVIELHEAEIALASLQSELSAALRQRQRLAQLGEAVAKVSHDLRNILSTVQLLSDRLEESDDPAVKRLAPKLVRSVSRAVALSENTLAFGRADEPTPQLQRFCVGDIIDDVVTQETLALENTNQIQFQVTCNVDEVRADPEQLYRVLQNLVRNARQAFGPSHGQIDIVVGEDEASWTITVRDNGPGLPPKAIEHLFHPFSGGTKREGSGLGLAIAHELVVGHGGTLWLQDNSENGACFQITLPKGEI